MLGHDFEGSAGHIEDTAREFEHEELLVRHDPVSGLRAAIAVHSTVLGPAAGGCRRWQYAHTGDAVTDVLRLSQAMTYKNALARIPFGGGKSVILGDGNPVTVRQLHTFARWLNELGGSYIAAEDVGMGVQELRQIASKSGYVSGLGNTTIGGDPSPKTAYGVFVGIRTAVDLQFAGATLRGLRVGVQGLGNVGMRLCHWLARAGARLYVTDLDCKRVEQAVQKYGALPCSPDGLLTQSMDVFAPCAMGGIVDEELAAAMDVHVIAGAANNQLAGPSVGEILKDRDVLFAPDFVINAGGVISVAHEYLTVRGGFAETPDHDSEQWVGSRVDGIADRLRSIISDARLQNLDPQAVAIARAVALVENGGGSLHYQAA